MVGGICLVGRIARLGFLADLLSRPVLVGYLAGIALIMISGQLRNVTGVRVEGSTFLTDLASFVHNAGQVHGPTLVLAGAVLAFLIAVGALLPRAPGPLLAVLLAAAVTAALSLERLGVRVIGPVPAGLPAPQLPPVALADVTALLLPAVGVAVVAFSDNVLTGRAFASRRGHALDADQEMLALGAANLATSVLHGFPVSSSGSRTVIGDVLGSRSQLASVVTLLLVIVVLVAGGPVLAAFPTAALGALVVYAALRLIDVAEFRRFARFRRSELTLAVATTVAVLGVGVLYGVLVAVGLSILDLLRRVSRPHDGILGFVPGLARMHDVDDYPDATTMPGLVVYRYDAPLCFANSENFRRRAIAAVDAETTPVRWLLLNMEAVIEVDVTASDTLHQMCAELDRRGVVLAMARVKRELLDDLQRSGLRERIGDGHIFHIFPTLPTAVTAFRDQQRAGTTSEMPTEQAGPSGPARSVSAKDVRGGRSGPPRSR
jgi:SulP family sulfate permease